MFFDLIYKYKETLNFIWQKLLYFAVQIIKQNAKYKSQQLPYSFQ